MNHQKPNPKVVVLCPRCDSIVAHTDGETIVGHSNDSVHPSKDGFEVAELHCPCGKQWNWVPDRLRA